MAGIKINDLPNSTTLSNNDYIITENGVATQKTSIEQIINKVDDESKFNDRIANNLITTEPDLLLDARQGKVLDEKISEINNNFSTSSSSYNIKLKNIDGRPYISFKEVV